MRRLILSEFVTLDGVMEAPSQEVGRPWSGWVGPFASPEQHTYKFDEVQEAESLLIGRVTYETFAEAWPMRSGAFADKMNAMPKHVVSTTLQDPEWNNSRVINGDVAAEVARLKAQDGGPILVPGSRSLSHALMATDLVDEYRLMVMPVILGTGRRLFPEAELKTVLRLSETRPFPLGIVLLTYQREPE